MLPLPSQSHYPPPVAAGSDNQIPGAIRQKKKENKKRIKVTTYHIDYEGRILLYLVSVCRLAVVLVHVLLLIFRC